MPPLAVPAYQTAVPCRTSSPFNSSGSLPHSSGLLWQATGSGRSSRWPPASGSAPKTRSKVSTRQRTVKAATTSDQREAETMRFIVAVIQPHKLDAVREALANVGVQGLTVSEVRGFGRQKGHREIYRGAEYEIAYVPKVKLELAVPADLADRVVETIRDTAHTGNIGDGKIFVLGLESATRVRTGETGASAL